MPYMKLHAGVSFSIQLAAFQAGDWADTRNLKMSSKVVVCHFYPHGF
jgi:hypothetical protein